MHHELQCKNFIILHFRCFVDLRNDLSGVSQLVIRRRCISALIFRCCGAFIIIRFSFILCVSVEIAARSLTLFRLNFDSCRWIIISILGGCADGALIQSTTIDLLSMWLHRLMALNFRFHGENLECDPIINSTNILG